MKSKYIILLVVLSSIAYADCSSAPVSYMDIITAEIDSSGLRNFVENPEALVAAVISQESSWNPNAMGDRGDSVGLMQINIPQHPECDAEKLRAFDVQENIRCGVNLLARIAATEDIDTLKTYSCRNVQYSGIDSMLRYYNGWPSSGCSGDPNYVENVMRYYNDLVACYTGATTPEQLSTVTTTAYGNCRNPYEAYPCDYISSCTSSGGVPYAGYCRGPVDIQCCVPRDSFARLTYVNDESEVLGQKTEDAANEALGKLETEQKVTVFFEIVPEIGGEPKDVMNVIYEREELEKSSMRALFVLDTDTKKMYVRGSCSYFTSQMWNIVMANENNKALLDNSEYDQAFRSIASDIYTRISSDPEIASCSDSATSTAASDLIISAYLGHNWLEKLGNTCRQLPALLDAAARKVNVEAGPDLADNVCRNMLHKEIRKRLQGEMDRIDAAILHSYAETQYVAQTPPCSYEGMYGCVALLDGTYDIRECVDGRLENDAGVATTIFDPFSDRAAHYATLGDCRDRCNGNSYSAGKCAPQDEAPVEYGTDEALGALGGHVERESLQADRDGVAEILRCYDQGMTLGDILNSAEYCQGITLGRAALLGQAFVKNAEVRTLQEVETLPGPAEDRTLCDISWMISQRIENPPVAVSTINARDKINAYGLVFSNCRGLGYEDTDQMAYTASEVSKELAQSGFFHGVWNVAVSFSNPTNLKIIAGTAIISVAIPPVAVGILGESAATVTASAATVRGFQTATTAYFAVPIAVGMPASIEACRNAGLDSQRCGEAVTQGAMLAALIKATSHGVGEIRALDANYAQLRERFAERLADLEARKPLLEQQLQGCATGCNPNRLEFLNRQMEEIRRSAETLDSSDQAYMRTILEFIDTNPQLAADNAGIKTSLVEGMRSYAGGNQRLLVLTRAVERALADAERSPLQETAAERSVRGVLDETGARTKPMTASQLLRRRPQIEFRTKTPNVYDGVEKVEYVPNGRLEGYIDLKRPDFTSFDYSTYQNMFGLELQDANNVVIFATDAATGAELGYLSYYRVNGGGFAVAKVEVEASAWGKGVASGLYREAFSTEGPYRGPYPVVRTAEGAAFIRNMMSKYPEIFDGYAENPGSVPVLEAADVEYVPEDISAVDSSDIYAQLGITVYSP